MITDNIILWDTKYGVIHCNLKNVLKKMDISLYQLERITGIKYDVLKRYYDDVIMKYDANILAKLCYSLRCRIDELLQYDESSK